MSDTLNTIMDLTLKNPGVLKSNFLDGKLLTSVNLIHVSKTLKNRYLFDLGYDILDHCVNDEIFHAKAPISINFLNGRIGLVLAIAELAERDLIEFDLSELTEIVDEDISDFFNNGVIGLSEKLSLQLYFQFHESRNFISVNRLTELRKQLYSHPDYQKVKKLPALQLMDKFSGIRRDNTPNRYLSKKRMDAIAGFDEIEALIGGLGKHSQFNTDLYLLALKKRQNASDLHLIDACADLLERMISSNELPDIEIKCSALNKLLLLISGSDSGLLSAYWQFAILSGLEMHQCVH